MGRTVLMPLLTGAQGPLCAPWISSSYPALVPTLLVEGMGRIMKGFCGANFNPLGYIANNAPVISCECPFELDHVTGITALNGNGVASAGVGFQLAYIQLPGNCR